MERFFIEHTSKSPKINFNPQEGEFEINGRSILENPFLFYKPAFEWLEAYLKAPRALTHLNVQLEYFNSGTSKCLLEFFKKLEDAHQKALTTVKVNWYYEADDDSIFEAGEDFQLITSLPIELKELKVMSE